MAPEPLGKMRLKASQDRVQGRRRSAVAYVNREDGISS